ncbi:hypothetical protein L484_002197 [Morus notabilis]|uniref:Uncharacterized protein n=1 Tax=Morus notabilis TaxID=981085 RepID=W9QUT7_9ROSA|nr:hypothetical protein L484_002197 [Morus notabilis]
MRIESPTLVQSRDITLFVVVMEVGLWALRAFGGVAWVIANIIWSALYSTSLINGDYNPHEIVITRLTPQGSTDYSHVVSLSGEFVAVASYGSHPWGGEFLLTHEDKKLKSPPTTMRTTNGDENLRLIHNDDKKLKKKSKSKRHLHTQTSTLAINPSMISETQS